MKPKTEKKFITIDRDKFLRLLNYRSSYAPGLGYTVYMDQVRYCLSRAKQKTFSYVIPYKKGEE